MPPENIDECLYFLYVLSQNIREEVELPSANVKNTTVMDTDSRTKRYFINFLP